MTARIVAGIALLGTLLGSATVRGELLVFTDAEVRAIVRHGPWPQPALRDPSNRASGDEHAIALGQRLFFDERLSANGAIACGTCHVPAKAWTDGRQKAAGLAPLDRNAPSVVNAGLLRWFSWDGGADSLWAQALRAMLHPSEMGTSAQRVAERLRADRELACLYETAFGADALQRDDERVLVDSAKAIAAFVATLGSGRSAFDEFRDSLARGEADVAARYPLPAQRGVRIFVGRGNCTICHFGPSFTDGEFHDVGVPFMSGPGRVDAGRYEGIKRLRADPYNLLGKYSADPSGASATKTRHVELQQANFGQFKTPSLRNVELTAPYMHEGRYATLREVVLHYSDLDVERLHLHGEQLLRPLKLSPDEVDDLVAFLRTLTDPRANEIPKTSTVVAPCRRDASLRSGE